MARVPASEIERLKREVSLERLAVAKGVKLTPRGKELVGPCPFCGTEGQTLIIVPETNLWRCDGACQTGGHVVDWVMKAEGVSQRLAVELLHADLGGFEAFTAQKRGRQKGRVAEKSTTVKLAGFEASAEDHVLLRGVFDFYHETLKQSPEALAYLEKRGLRSSEMIERFRLGFANRTLAYRLPQKNRKDGAEVRGRLQKLGVLRESGHEHFNGSVVIPVFDDEGGVVQAHGRKITPGLREGTPLHLWLTDSQRGVWNHDALQASRQVIICASFIDALSFWCAGFRNVTAIAGLDGSLDEHLAVFAKHGVEQVMLAFRRSPEGDRAAGKAAERLGEAGVECFRVVFPKGMDANDFLLRQPGGFEELLRQAEWMGKGTAKTADVVTPAPASTATSTDTPVAAAPSPVEPSEPPAPAAFVPAPGAPATAPTPVPTPPVQPTPSTNADEVTFQLGDRLWRIRGLSKNTGIESMKVNVLCSREGADSSGSLQRRGVGAQISPGSIPIEIKVFLKYGPPPLFFEFLTRAREVFATLGASIGHELRPE